MTACVVSHARRLLLETLLLTLHGFVFLAGRAEQRGRELEPVLPVFVCMCVCFFVCIVLVSVSMSVLLCAFVHVLAHCPIPVELKLGCGSPERFGNRSRSRKRRTLPKKKQTPTSEHGSTCIFHCYRQAKRTQPLLDSRCSRKTHRLVCRTALMHLGA